ncbi:hypothetical protein, partial [Pseudomonas syringae]
MELVILVRANLYRVGSTQGGGFGGNHKNITVIREVQDEKPESVRQIVIEIAEENGESAGALAPLRLESTWSRGVPALTFNIQSPRTMYSHDRINRGCCDGHAIDLAPE